MEKVDADLLHRINIIIEDYLLGRHKSRFTRFRFDAYGYAR